MFGHLLLVLKEGVVKNFGSGKWEEVKKKCKILTDIEETGSYDIKLFDAVMKASIDVCGVNLRAFQNLLGDAYLSQIQSKGNYQLIRLLGRSFLDFLMNIDFVHTVAIAKYPKADIPFFRVDSEHVSQDMIRLHYYSKWTTMSPLVESLLTTIGRVFFSKDVSIRILQEGQDGERYHILYSIDLIDIDQHSNSPPTLVAQTTRNAEKQIGEKNVAEQKEKIEFIRREYGESALPVQRERMAKTKWNGPLKVNMLYKRLDPTIPRTLSIGPKDFCEIFPYHIVFDRSMLLKQSGVEIQGIITEFHKVDIDITKYLELVHPIHKEFSFENVESLIYSPHILKCKSNSLSVGVAKKQSVYLRGQMIEITEKGYMFFLCSPLLSTLNDLEANGMRMSELPNHDLTKYFISNHSMSDVDWMDGFLGRTSTSSNDTNLSRGTGYNQYGTMPPMIPSLVTNVIRDGKKYKNCSVLFCDIVQFSSLVDSCEPSDILSLLNSLHDGFDYLAQVHGVHKIEVVGDAYLVVSGIPKEESIHAERVANMSLAMILLTKSIKSPFNYGAAYGKRALIRIGMHYGDVIGGIIGSSVPKFTVMGDTIVTTSRMESHGVADKIHISAAAFRELSSFHFDMTERGCIEIRGKGRQFTYFLNKNVDLSDESLLGKTKENIYNHSKR